MDRRFFLGSMIAGAVVTKTQGLLSSAVPGDKPTPAPHWLGTEPLIYVPLFIPGIAARRMGWNATWLDSSFQKAASEEAISKLRDLGVTLVHIALFDGLGLEAEKENIADSQKLAALLKRFGIRVGVYVGSTIMYETFLLEKPEAKEWLVPDYLGKPVIYSNQTYRKRVYFMHPGYLEYMKRVLRIGIEDLHAEFIHFDNTSMQAERPIFQHPLAIEDFRTFLRSRYSAAGLKERLGFSDVRYVEPPRDEEIRSTIDDPLFQEWTEFRCQQLARYYAELREFIRSLNPNVVMAVNAHLGISGWNTIWDGGVDYPTLMPQVDIVFSEEGDYAGTTPDGILVSKIRSYKMATILNKRVLTRTTYAHPAKGGETVVEIPGGRVQMAESMVYNRQSLGNVGAGMVGYNLPEEERGYIRFFREHFDLYRGVETVADVALVYTHATMGFNNDRPAVSFMLFAQTLIQAKIPFDLIFDEHLKDLSKYRVLVLADQECLSDEQLDLIRKFVQKGGGLVATEHTSLYTAWRWRRLEFGLHDLWPVAAPAWRGIDTPEEVIKTDPVRGQVGRGRVVYVSEVKPALSKPTGEPMTSQYWKLPENWRELVDSVRWAAGGQLTLEVAAPLTVTAELLTQPKTGRLLLHLINYDFERTPSIENIQVRLRGRQEGKNLSMLSPDGQAQTLTPTMREGELAFTIPTLRAYTVALIS